MRRPSRCPSVAGGAAQCALLAALALLLAACCPELGPAKRPAVAPPSASALAPQCSAGVPRAALHAEARAVLAAAGIDADALPCNSRVRWVRGLKRFTERAVAEIAASWQQAATEAQRQQAAHVITGYFIRVLYQELDEQNLGVMRLRGMTYRDAQGRQRPMLVFRSAMLVDWDRPQSCLAALIRRAGVAHVINLYAGTFPLQDLVAREKALAKRLGATHHDEREAARPWRKLVEEEQTYTANKRLAMERIAALIREQILAPGGAPPRGSVYLHCGGGMHRSGMIFGILRRCINRDPLPLIEAEYRRHTACSSPSEPNGFEELNLRLIREFDCTLLRGGSR